ncbi:MAG TPA: alpha/beta fold hydrolase [Granulicella sp.]|jgi:pimeloyl-ACP methyl ester carboxylesterase|nr:alpha/beta fold hydrolase [Granulicella sp.]
MTPPRPPRPSQRSTPSSAVRPSSPKAPADPYALNPNPEVVDPRWLLKALAVILLAALVCGYLTLCVLFYQGEWQLVLHPSRSTPAPASIADSPFEIIQFGLKASATPQLTGWWLPAAPGSRYAASTVLYLTSGDGSLADAQSAAIPTLAALHTAGINVFAFDYRGYGQSLSTHPNQRRMQQDADLAWQYLTGLRSLPPSQIVLFGTGVGAALATELAAQHPQIPALILQNPRPGIFDSVSTDPRTKLLPLRLLFHDRFEITQPLSTLATPKLFLLCETPHPADKNLPALQDLIHRAATPKVNANLHPADFDGPLYREEITRFLDQYLPTPPVISQPQSSIASPLPLMR